MFFSLSYPYFSLEIHFLYFYNNHLHIQLQDLVTRNLQFALHDDDVESNQGFLGQAFELYLTLQEISIIARGTTGRCVVCGVGVHVCVWCVECGVGVCGVGSGGACVCVECVCVWSDGVGVHVCVWCVECVCVWCGGACVCVVWGVGVHVCGVGSGGACVCIAVGVLNPGLVYVGRVLQVLMYKVWFKHLVTSWLKVALNKCKERIASAVKEDQVSHSLPLLISIPHSLAPSCEPVARDGDPSH